MLDLRGNKITYYGHSTFGLKTPSGQVALIDPWVMTNPRCPDALKKVARLDAIFLSHGHSDHMGDLLELAKQHQPKVVSNFEIFGWSPKAPARKECRATKEAARRPAILKSQ